LERVRELWYRTSTLAGQFYTPRELRALVFFVLTGVAILLFRFGKQEYFTYFPNRKDPSEMLQQHRADSIFFALSAAASRRDSLFFSVPEDSLLPASIRNRTEHHSKEEDLLPHSISLNLGTKEDLVLLPGVGSATAERILEYREERGRFRTLEEIENIPGFGVTKFEKIKRFLKLN
jgi:competence ComEA-like helix-hairpin-helix protein